MPSKVAIAGSVAALLLLMATPAPRDRAHDLAKSASKVEPETCGDVQTFEDCHDNYPVGCSDSDNPRFDAYLNFLKNQMLSSDLQPVRSLSEHDFRKLDDSIPQSLTSRNHAAHANDLAELGEGNIYSLMGFLYYAMATGPETCNCKLSGSTNVDFHLGVGFDPDMAKKVAAGEHLDKSDLDQASVVVEMTPHYRGKFHPKWTIARLKQAVGKQVRVVGQLIIDNEHAVPSQDCGRSNADKNTCWRESAWELHPVVQFYVCKSDSPCGPNSANWQKLDDRL